MTKHFDFKVFNSKIQKDLSDAENVMRELETYYWANFGNSKKTISLFKFFVAHIGQKLSTNRIMESVFSQYKYQDPSNTLRGHIHRLRAVLNKINEETGSKVLTIDYLADHYIFSIGPDCQVDYLEFLDEVPLLLPGKYSSKSGRTWKHFYFIFYLFDFLQ